MIFLALIAILGLFWMSGHWGPGPGFGFFPFWPLLILLFLFTCGRNFGSHRARHHRGHTAPAPDPQDPALTTLRERFARGEIDRAEYEERRATLLDRKPKPSPNPAPQAEQPEQRQEWPDLI